MSSFLLSIVILCYTNLSYRVTKSPFSDLVPDYVQAQEVGEGKQAPGECFPYFKDCPKSIFKALSSKYSKPAPASKTKKTKPTDRPVGEYHEEQVIQLPTTRDQDNNVYM